MTGSGKTFCRQLIVNQLCEISKGKKRSKTKNGLKYVYTVLNAFGNSQTMDNVDASHYGLYTEVQYNSHGKIIGAKFLDYILDKHHLYSTYDYERNFHVFYYLLAGASQAEKSYWRLGETTSYEYLSGERAVNQTDEKNYENLAVALKSLGIGRRTQRQIFQLLAAILHIGNIHFIDAQNPQQDSCQIKNLDELEIVSEYLGIHPRNLETILTYKTMLIKRELCTVFLTAEHAEIQKNEFASLLYSLLFRWIVEYINTKLCKTEEETANFIGIMDFRGTTTNEDGDLYQLLANFANEKIYQFTNQQLFKIPAEDYKYQKINIDIPLPVENIDTPFGKNKDVIELFTDGKSLLSVMDSECNRSKPDTQRLLTKLDPLQRNDSFVLSNDGFSIRHYFGDCDYNVDDFIKRNSDNMNSDFVALLKGSGEMPASSNEFIKDLFSEKAVTTKSLPGAMTNNICEAQQSQKPLRAPSTKRMKGRQKPASEIIPTIGNQLNDSLNEVIDTMSNTNPWFVYCIRPNKSQRMSSYKFDIDFVKKQIEYFGIIEVAKAREYDFTSYYNFDEFLEIFNPIIEPMELNQSDPKDKCIQFAKIFNWTDKEFAIGNSKVFIAEEQWKILDNEVRAVENALKSERHKDEEGENGEDRAIIMGEGIEGSSLDESESQLDTEIYQSEEDLDPDTLGELEGIIEKDGKKDEESSEEEEEEHTTTARKQWVCCTYLLTFYICNCCLAKCGKMVRKDIQMAWREKFALNLIILLLNLGIMFYIVGLGQIICPKKNWMTHEEIGIRSTKKSMLVGLHGRYLDVTDFLKENNHRIFEEVDNYVGRDVSYMFWSPLDLWGVSYCLGEYQGERKRHVESGMYIHRQDEPPTTQKGQKTGYKKDYVHYLLKNYFKGWIVENKKIVNVPTNLSKGSSYPQYVIIHDNIYDISSYFNSPTSFLGEFGNVVLYPKQNADITREFEEYRSKYIMNGNNVLNSEYENYHPDQCLRCMGDLFFYGKVDHRNDFKCQLTNYILFIGSLIIVMVIGVKFLAALQLSSRKDPEDHDKFVICQVPCYTEDEESLLRTIKSLSILRYDDKRKLLFIIADGMIIGSGNDRPTPRIVLDLLGVDPSVDPESFAFQSIGEGMKQYNMAKIYSGLYECQGRSVPFIVVVKVGAPSERSRPGNRGKRDSQMILMRFLSKVHNNSPMSPMELELYHQIKNIIGVNPSFYEYILMVDADTQVEPDSLNRMVSCMIHDSKIMGICGETQLLNEKDSWVTMIQVYEYFISHHLAKAFESLFGSVTCLPGCFSMYRIRTPTKRIPLLISNAVIEDYSECKVDTLHKKNLLSLGEDRYLTTLLMKHFPQMKLKFTPDALCQTNVPDRFAVLLSQRRRWINSTVHNLIELLFLPQLCGFCCFSLRFVVMIDLFATLIQPVTLLYMIYLIYYIIFSGESLPTISLLLILSMYGFQIIIFLLKKQWQHVGWMIIYLMAMPLYGFFIPLYSFWHFDDFSWGNTRVVVGDGKKKEYLPETEKFKLSMIPTKTWDEYEQELYEQSTKDSRMDGYSDHTLAKSDIYAPSMPAIPPQSMQMQQLYAESAYAGSAYNAPAYQSQYVNSNGLNPNTSMVSSVPPSQRNSMEFAGFPSDEEIVAQIQNIIYNSDLMKITKKQVREELSEYFGIDMSAKKDFINCTIEEILSGQM
ncbi:glycosyltransferase family 2 protein [Piromyces sp. E2]|nr:glycosyltransferase family 2 protein [Piromyces sp. E2]|eukprot:OUM61397.1 glycosyltransferase family 2 protein [Piromyces sp. E2]